MVPADTVQSRNDVLKDCVEGARQADGAHATRGPPNQIHVHVSLNFAVVVHQVPRPLRCLLSK